jgi:hypothetical protein
MLQNSIFVLPLMLADPQVIASCRRNEPHVFIPDHGAYPHVTDNGRHHAGRKFVWCSRQRLQLERNLLALFAHCFGIGAASGHGRAHIGVVVFSLARWIGGVDERDRSQNSGENDDSLAHFR